MHEHALVSGLAGQYGGDDADGSDDGSTDGPDIDPTACTSSRACDPVVEICVEVEPTSTSDNCSSHWQCFTHDYDDGTLAHMCPPEVVSFCGCDGKEFQASYACPGLPYDHIGACSDGYSCDAGRVRCATARPVCSDGQVPAVIAGCWGPCVPLEMCRCDLSWECPPGSRCSLLPDFRCGAPVDAGAGDGG